MISRGLEGINLNEMLKHNNIFPELFVVLLYADATLILAKTADLQMSLKNLEMFCRLLKIKVNVPKTKLMIFNKNCRIC